MYTASEEMIKAFVKSETETKAVVAGYAVVFGGADLHGEYFTPETDFELDWIPTKKLLYDHGMSGHVKGVLGSIPLESITQDDIGLFIEAEIDKSHRYAEAVLRLVKGGMLGFSSGTIPQLMARDEDTPGKIVKWPIAEVSLTATPAEPRTLGVVEIKQLAKYYDQLQEWVPTEELEETASKTVESTDEGNTQTDSEETQSEGETKMSDVNINTGAGNPESRGEAFEKMNELFSKFSAKMENQDSELASVREDANNLNVKIDSILEYLEKGNAAKAGVITQDGGKADPEVKNFADFLVAVKRGDAQRLHSVYRSTKDLGEDSGASGGYLVPQEYEETLLQMAAMNNPVSGRVRRIPVTRPAGNWPALDQYITPSAGSGQTAFAAGVTTAITPAGEALTETEPGFSMLEWRLHKIGGFTEVDNELIEDSPFAIEALLSGLFSVAVGAKNERNILRGNGVGEPLGILNAPAAIGVTPATDNSFTWPDVAAFQSRFMGAGGSPIWLIHPGVWPDILTMEIGSAGAAAWTANMQAAAGNNINGYTILQSEHLPQDDNAGCVLFADLSAYLFFEKRGLTIAYSEHAAFTSEKGTWRFSTRNDGKPWLKNAVTLADPQGSYTMSPFIYLND